MDGCGWSWVQHGSCGKSISRAPIDWHHSANQLGARYFATISFNKNGFNLKLRWELRTTEKKNNYGNQSCVLRRTHRFFCCHPLTQNCWDGRFADGKTREIAASIIIPITSWVLIQYTTLVWNWNMYVPLILETETKFRQNCPEALNAWNPKRANLPDVDSKFEKTFR